jgi:hypothetical protein
VKRGDRVINGKELIERLGRNDPCPCGSGRRFQAVLHARRQLSMGHSVTSIAATEGSIGAASAAPIGSYALNGGGTIPTPVPVEQAYSTSSRALLIAARSASAERVRRRASSSRTGSGGNQAGAPSVRNARPSSVLSRPTESRVNSAAVCVSALTMATCPGDANACNALLAGTSVTDA